jgi:predicted Zn-dependent protease
VDYSNPEIPEGINTSKQHPLKDFFILSIGVLGSIALCAFLLGLFAERLALHIPFSVEQELLESIEFEDPGKSNAEVQDYLNDLTSELLPHIALAEDITVQVTYVDDSIENAFASLGGQVWIYRGLIELLPNENALAMVIAHEIAHIQQRDPIIALGRGVVVGLFLTAIAGSSTDRFVSSVVSDTGSLTVLGFNRKQEQRADEIALKAIAEYYGHVNGADELFKAFLKQEDKHDSLTPEFFSTHPLSDDRIKEIKIQADKNNWQTTGPTVALPNFITKSK